MSPSSPKLCSLKTFVATALAIPLPRYGSSTCNVDNVPATPINPQATSVPCPSLIATLGSLINVASTLGSFPVLLIPLALQAHQPLGQGREPVQPEQPDVMRVPVTTREGPPLAQELVGQLVEAPDHDAVLAEELVKPRGDCRLRDGPDALEERDDDV
ncbi:hypothetical protein VM1G_11370 [Cytospora mali]|uniref:Uncharacterized protein n=1 Tax=Cytospora mali TaxID=578113 RepID=A0A194VNN8_CYTMA|nr:hypothetical protein VM1G_11370 [Valsa mali]